MGRSSRHLALLLVLALAFLFSWGPTPGRAGTPGTTSWTGSTGKWEETDPLNWDNGIPTDSLDAVIDNGGTAQIAAQEAAAQNLAVGSSVSGSGIVDHTNQSLTVGGTLTLGSDGEKDEIDGKWYASSGKYYMNHLGMGGPSLQVGDLIVSDKGYGTFLQQGGSVTVYNDLILGNQILPGDPQNWTYPISGQYTMWQGWQGVAPPSLVVYGQLIVGNEGYGGFEQYNGSVTLLGEALAPGAAALVIGKEADSFGYYYLENDASLTVGQEWLPVNMYVGQAGSGYFSIDYYGGAGSFQLFGNLVVGDQAGSNGMVEQNGGTATVTGDLILGNLSGSYGQYDLRSGSLTVGTAGAATPSILYVGKGGEGYFYQYDGELTVNGTMVVGDQAGSSGSVLQGYGAATVYGNLILGNQDLAYGFYQFGGLGSGEEYISLNVQGNMILGQYGQGNFFQTGGTVTVSHDLILGALREYNLSDGSYNLFEGSYNFDDDSTATSPPAFLNVGGSLIVGQSGNSYFSQAGGAVTVGADLVLGQEPDSIGRYSLFEGTSSWDGGSYTTGAASLNVTGNMVVGDQGIGDFSQEGGSVTVGGSLILANGDTHGDWDGVYGLLNGGLTVGAAEIPTAMTVGAGGRGLFLQYGGNLLVYGDLIVGDREGSVGAVDHSSGETMVIGNLILGNERGENAAIGDYYLFADVTNLNAPSLNVTGYLIVANEGQGSFSQEGGAVTVCQDLILGKEGPGNDNDYAYGSYHLFQGTKVGVDWEYTTGEASLYVVRNLIVGQFGNGHFTQQGGTVTVASNLILGQEYYSYGSYSLFEGWGEYANGEYYTITTGPANLHVLGNLIVGQYGMGEFFQDGGNVQVDGSLILANGDLGAGSYQGAYHLYNGNLTVGTAELSAAMIVGAWGQGYFYQGGGLLTVHGDLIVGDGGYGSVYQSFGTTTVMGTLTVGNQGQGYFDQYGGSVQASSLILGVGNSGNYSLSGGSLDVAAMYVGEGNWGSFAIDNGGTFTAWGDMVVGDQPSSHGSVTQNDGTATVTGSLTLGSMSWSYGEYSLVGGSLTVGTPGAYPPNTMYVGAGGEGYFYQYWGELTVNGNLIVGDQAGSHGQVYQWGGTATVTGDLILGNEGSTDDYYRAVGYYGLYGGDENTPFLEVTGNLILGMSGQGVFDTSGGFVQVGQDLVIASEPGSYGEYYLVSGALTVGNSPGDLYVGKGGEGYFIQDDGMVQVKGNLILGNAGAAFGAYILVDGDLTVGQEGSLASTMVVGKGGSGQFALGFDPYYEGITGTPFFTLHGNLIVGDQAGSEGTVIQKDGDAWIAGSVTLGNAGSIPNPEDPDNPIPAAMGMYALVNGSLTVGQEGSLASNMVVGKGGAGGFFLGFETDDPEITGNPIFTLHGNLLVGEQAGSIGGVIQYDGTANIKGSATLGNAGPDTTNPAAMGTYMLVNGTMYVGGWPGETGDPPQPMVVGKSGAGYFIMGMDFEGMTGEPTFRLNGDLVVGQQAGSLGGVLHAGGEATVHGNLSMGVEGPDITDPENPKLAALGGYVMSPVDPLISPSLTVNGNLEVGVSGFGGFNQTGGSVNAGEVFIGREPDGLGGYVLEGGTLNTQNLSVGFKAIYGTHQLPAEIMTPMGPITLLEAAEFFPFLQYLPIDYENSTFEGPGGNFFQTGGDIYTNHVEVGAMPGSWGYYKMSGGSLNITPAGDWDGALILGRDGAGGGSDAAQGVFELSGAGSVSASRIRVGDGGYGTFIQSGGQVNAEVEVGAQMGSIGDYRMSEGSLGESAQGNLTLGRDWGATGNFDLSGGSVYANEVFVGLNGQGTFNQSGGTLTSNSIMVLGQEPGASGFYNLDAGNINAQSITVGLSGQGTFIQTGGEVNTGHLEVGALPGSTGRYQMSGGSLNVYPQVTLILGRDGADGVKPAAVGTFELSGTGSVNATTVYVGQSGQGNFTQSGGTLNTWGIMVLGEEAGATGTYNLQDGTLNAQNITVGYGGQGTFTQSGGSLTFASGGQLRVGLNGTGTFTQTGGSVTFNSLPTTTDYLTIGANGGIGYYYLQEETATLTVDGMTIVGQAPAPYSGGSGYFYQSGGTHSILRTTLPAYGGDGGRLLLGNGEGTYGEYRLSEGQLIVGGKEVLGLNGGTGVFLQTGGTNTITADTQPDGVGRLVVGRYDNSVGTYELSGGGFIADRIVLGDSYGGSPGIPDQPLASGKGTLTISGGSLVVKELYVGWEADAGHDGFGKLDLASQDIYVEVSQTLYIGPIGIFTAVPGAVIHMTGSDYVNSSTTLDNMTGLANLKMIFSGGPEVIDNFEVGFNLNTLEIAPYSQVELVDLYDNIIGVDGLHVASLVLGQGAILYTHGLYFTFDSLSGNLDQIVTHTPLPGSVWLLLSGLAGLGLARGWRLRKG